MSDFVICINNDANPASLILGKVYRRLPDAEAESHNMLRVVDEDTSEPDGYLYPASIFAPIELPESAQRRWQQRAVKILRQAESKTPDPVVRCSRPPVVVVHRRRTSSATRGMPLFAIAAARLIVLSFPLVLLVLALDPQYEAAVVMFVLAAVVNCYLWGYGTEWVVRHCRWS